MIFVIFLKNKSEEFKINFGVSAASNLFKTE